MTNDAPEILYAAGGDDGWLAPYCGCAPCDGATAYVRKDVADAAVAAEREACAKVARRYGDQFEPHGHPAMGDDEVRIKASCHIAENIRARAGTDALAARDARARAEALRDAAEAWDNLRYVAVQNTNDPEEWAALIARMDAALIPADQEGDG